MRQFRAAQEYLGSESGRLLVLWYAADPAKFTEQVEQQQHAPENGVSGMEVFEAESVRT